MISGLRQKAGPESVKPMAGDVYRCNYAYGLHMRHASRGILQRRKQMADEKIEKKIDETTGPQKEAELTDSDFEKVAGGTLAGTGTSPNPASGTYSTKSCCV
jgi:hypothetical protein